MAQKSYGTVRQKIDVSINILNIIEKIVDAISDTLIEAINQEASDCEIDDYEFDGDNVCYSGYYETDYSSTYYPGTRFDPPEYDEKRGIECLDEKTITEYIRNNIPKNIDITDIIDSLSVRISEDDDDSSYEEDKPDWDSMPGGHDDY